MYLMEIDQYYLDRRRYFRLNSIIYNKYLVYKQHNLQQEPCVYCMATDHKSFKCNKFRGVKGRREISCQKRLCFNCTCANHHATECQVKGACNQCHSRHYTSICDRQDKLRNSNSNVRMFF